MKMTAWVERNTQFSIWSVTNLCDVSRREGFSVKPIFHIDIVLLIIGALLVVTMAGFLTEQLPYPVGFFVLVILFVARILHLKSKK